MHSVCRCSLPVWRRSFLKKGTPRDLFWPRPGSAPGRIWLKNNNTCKGPWVLHPYQVSSKSIERFWRRSRKCESLRTTDERTDDGRCAMTIAHSSLRLRWAKKCGPPHGNIFDLRIGKRSRSPYGTNRNDLSQGSCMPNINALSFILQKIWARFKILWQTDGQMSFNFPRFRERRRTIKTTMFIRGRGHKNKVTYRYSLSPL